MKNGEQRTALRAGIGGRDRLENRGMKKITSFRVLENYQVWLRFDDGVEGVADLSALVGKGVFAAWRDYEFFRRAYVADYGSLTWPGDLDLCPDALWLQVTGKHPEDLSPNLKALASYA